MLKKKVVLLGTGGHAKCLLYIMDEMGGYEVIGVTSHEKDKSEFCGHPIIGNDDILEDLFTDGIRHIALGVGGFTDNNRRRELFIWLKKLGFTVVSAIHPSAVIAKSASLGEGSVVFPGAMIIPDTHAGDNFIIGAGSTLGHDTIIEDHVLMSGGVTVGSFSLIQEGAVIALGATVGSGVKVGRNAMVACGAVAVKDVKENTRVYGIPARPKLDQN